MNKPTGYKICTDAEMAFLEEIWISQGITSNNCTGMSSFTMIIGHTPKTFRAHNDDVVLFQDWNHLGTPNYAIIGRSSADWK